MESHTSSLFQQYLPSSASVPMDQRDRFKALTIANNRVTLKDAFKNYRNILLNTTAEDIVDLELIRRHIQAGILAEAILGNTQLHFQALQLINLIGSVDITHLLNILTRVSTNDHLRNISELMDVFTVEQLRLSEVQAAFVLPLINAFQLGTQRIVSEAFSVKWLNTFIELVRSINNLLKKQDCLSIQQKQHLIELTRSALQLLGILRRDIITQLYTIVVTLNAEEPEPNNILAKVHYLHCKSIVYNTPVLSQLLMYTSIPETQTKHHLLYGLCYSLEKEFSTYSHKHEVFERIVELYEVGRTATRLIEKMIRIIVKEGAPWRIDGYIARKFFVARCIIKAIDDCQQVIAQWPSILSEAIEYSGNLNTPFAIECVELILGLLFRRCQQDGELWLKMWIDDYLRVLVEGDRLTIRGIIEFINPIICRISKRPVLLRRLLQVDDINKHSEESIQLAIISLLQCYRENGFIEPQESGVYEFKGEPQINIPANKLDTLLQSNNCSIALKSFEFVTVSQKLSEVVNAFEYKLITGFYCMATITSNADYRRGYVIVTKRFFERLRTIYQKELLPPVKKGKPVKLFDEFQRFMSELLEYCFACLYPDMPFERANPALEIILNILNFFGVYDYEVRKGKVIQGNALLRGLGVFNQPNFGVLVSCLQSSFENIRTLAYSTLRLFPSDFEFDSHELWHECLNMTNSLVIRQFESGCRLICFLFERYRLKTPVPKAHDLPELDLYEYLLQLMQQRYEIFSKDFTNQTMGKCSNLVHGLCTCFAYLFDQLSKNIKTSPQMYSIYANTIKSFVSKLFGLLMQIIAFAVEVSCANVSDIVLDSQQSKLISVSGKLKVDCQAHLIQQEKKQFIGNVEKMLSGSTLMSSVDDEEGSIDNTLVVSFYMLTRESGLLYQSVATLAEADSKQLYLSEKALIDVIYSFFYALVNLKHIGSIDRIAKGLQKMLKALYKQENQSLATLPEILLKRLLQLLEESKFTNILRRSAGIPYAFTCLLKSGALHRKYLIQNTLNKLFYYARNESLKLKELRIHSLNILKKLFLEGDLRLQLDPFVSEAFVLSIKGFGTEDWGVRNSSLMLFSSLSLRTLGPKPQLNLMQFFQKCPSLIDYFMEELNSYIKTKSMYPPLYPIALLLSRLVPFEHMALNVRDTYEKNSKLLRHEQLNKFIPLLIEAGNTPNYMGRVIIGKALLPFLQPNQILDFCTGIITNIQLGNSNKLHNQLLIVYHLMSCLYQIQQISQEKSPERDKYLSDKDTTFFREFNNKMILVGEMNCPLVQEMFVKVAHLFLEKSALLFEHILPGDYQKFINWFQVYAQRYIAQNIYELPHFRFKQDLGHSVFRIEMLRLALGLSNRLTRNNKSIALFEEFFSFVGQKCSDIDYWRKLDSEVVIVYLHELKKLLKTNKKTTMQPSYQELINKLIKITFAEYTIPAVIAEILLIFKRLKVALSENQIKSLLNKSNTNHQPLKIAIFKLLCQQKCDLRDMMDEFSRPDQLIYFRESAAKSIRHFDENLLPTYIRLLQDEDSQVRKFTADKLSTIMGLPHLNEMRMVELLFDRITLSQVKMIIDDGDIGTKRKNNEQMRIFSFDKANKFRSDIGNILCLLQKKRPVEFVKEGFLLKYEPDLFDSYSKRILQRNEYKFQVILRKVAYLVLVESKFQQAAARVRNLEPMLIRFVGHLVHHK